MPKNKKNKNKSAWVVAGGVAGVVVLYFVSSYAGLLGTKTFVGNDKISTSLECSVSANNKLEAKLTVSGSTFNSLALPAGRGLQAQSIEWSSPDAPKGLASSLSVTDENGIAQNKLVATNASAPSIHATYAGDRIRVDYRENVENAKVETVVVEYEASSCEITDIGN